MSQLSLWLTSDRQRAFLLSDREPFPVGTLVISDLAGNTRQTQDEWLAPHEISAERASEWIRKELGDTLTELRHGIDEKLADARRALENFKRSPTASAAPGEQAQLNADAGPALLDFLKSLPGVIGQSISGDEQRVDSARETLARLQQRLRDSGIDVDDRMKGFADRLASIRTEPKDKT